MERGTVVSFNNETGCGVIRTTNGRKTFFHYSDLINENFRTLHEGRQVYFDSTKVQQESTMIRIRLR
ncbi:MAG TPA: cold shock domain-containing protein [Deltaproteobacteria bacterium]|nr:cold shock domain-containing protein [Deltaproteobacteria bacterium]